MWELIGRSLELWSGEVWLVTDQMSTNRTQNDSKLAQLNNGIGQPDTLTTTILVENLTPVLLLSQSHYKPAVITVQPPKRPSWQGNRLQLILGY
ncbi:hypothetical protein H6G97_26530 [Nostoc flagelliforme FACHB-838]|uniref:Transposase n=1 Tax=Nostoc flagelliforme FACHB-838 TaxID=2692904 RepID=A0ABR8DUR7_9NOSO|nr:hypothetical protein [Nostoc flagelliforme]MBD2532939.1 hypothetical protein [Nostoc flagelliforme FACHB-838]